MSKTYILQKDWFFCGNDIGGQVYKAGEKLNKSGVDSAGRAIRYYEFSNKVIVHESWVENNPEWFLPEEKKNAWDGEGRGKEWGTPFERLAFWGTHSGWKYCGDCKEPVIKLSHFEKQVDYIEKENKSNDSFQWTPELQEKYISILERELFKNGMLPESFRKTFVELNTPKPQAENKPDWEIVSVLDTLSNKTYPFNSIDDKGRFKIHSVKRLSDGEVFSVRGRKIVNASATNLPHDGYEITHFTKIGDRMQVAVEGGFFWLDGIIHASEKLFTTEDGVRLQSGDIGREIYFITNHWEAKYWKVTEDFKPLEGVKYFYRKEAAEKYIADNKPHDYSKYDFTGAQKPIPQPQKEEQAEFHAKRLGEDLVMETTWQPSKVIINQNNYFTQQQVNAMCEDVWNAAREDSYSKTTRMTPNAQLIDKALRLLRYSSYEHYKDYKTTNSK